MIKLDQIRDLLLPAVFMRNSENPHLKLDVLIDYTADCLTVTAQKNIPGSAPERFFITRREIDDRLYLDTFTFNLKKIIQLASEGEAEPTVQ